LTLANTSNTLALLNGAGLHLGNASGTALQTFIYSTANTRMELSSALKITGGLEDTVIDGGTF